MVRSRKPSRDDSKRARKPPLIVVTEGKKTEPAYITAFSREHGATNVRVKGTGFDPQRVVTEAIELKNRLGRDAEAHVWAVFDKDEHERFDPALRLAQQEGINVAVSNPCFEIWAVFHYRDHAAPISAHECQRLLEQLCETYHRTSGKLFKDADVIRANHDAAVQRGKQSLHDREEEGDPQGNPSTSMHVLMESIRTQDNG